MTENNNKYFFILWMINPVGSAIYLFRNFKQNTNTYPYLLLSLFFGLSFVVSTTGADSARYAKQLVDFHNENISLPKVLASFYKDKDSKTDIYQPIVTWLVSIFTDNAKVLFAIFALVFGYFWFKSLIVIRSFMQIDLKGLALITFIFFALSNPIWNINGVRMWTAVAAFFYGIVVLNLKGSNKGWLFLLLSIFMHFSLILPLLFYLIYHFTPIKNTTVLFIIFIITFFVREVNLEIVRENFNLLPDFLQSKESYLSEQYVKVIKKTSKQYAFHVILAGIVSKYSIFAITLIMYYATIFNKQLKDKNVETFFQMALYMMSFSNLASFIPSGGRFLVLSNMILISAFLFVLNRDIRINVFLKSLLNLSLLFVIIFKIREGLDYISFSLFIGNPIINSFVEDDPIIAFIKSIF